MIQWGSWTGHSSTDSCQAPAYAPPCGDLGRLSILEYCAKVDTKEPDPGHSSAEDRQGADLWSGYEPLDPALDDQSHCHVWLPETCYFSSVNRTENGMNGYATPHPLPNSDSCSFSTGSAESSGRRAYERVEQTGSSMPGKSISSHHSADMNASPMCAHWTYPCPQL